MQQKYANLSEYFNFWHQYILIQNWIHNNIDKQKQHLKEKYLELSGLTNKEI